MYKSFFCVYRLLCILFMEESKLFLITNLFCTAPRSIFYELLSCLALSKTLFIAPSTNFILLYINSFFYFYTFNFFNTKQKYICSWFCIYFWGFYGVLVGNSLAHWPTYLDIWPGTTCSLARGQVGTMVAFISGDLKAGGIAYVYVWLERSYDP